MPLLTRAQRQTLVDLLMRLPNINDAANRNLLLTDLPSSLTRTIPFDGAAGIHIANIVNVVNDDTWARLPDGTVPVLLIIENAIGLVQGSVLAGELQSLLDWIKTGAAPPPVAPPAPLVQPPVQPPAALSLANLSGPQRRQLFDALLSAFPTYGALEQMVTFGLNENLAGIAGGGSLRDTVLNLITWAQAQGRLEELVRAARTENSGNRELRAFAEAAGLPV